jgi:lactoylglutathione lyase
MKIFDGLGHMALKVNDLDASIAFYEKLGFPEVLRLLNKEGRPWIVYLRITDGTLLELFPGGDGNPVPGPERTGLFHFCLTVSDIDAAQEKLAAQGISLSQPRKEGAGIDGNRGMWIEDPDGHRIEIMEMAADCIQNRALADFHKGAPSHALALN